MAFKSILTVASSAITAPLAISAAAKMARADDGHLEILALGVDRNQLGYSYIGEATVMVATTLKIAEADAQKLTASVKSAVAAESQDLRSSVETMVAQLGSLSDLVAQRARFADLVVLARPYGPGHAPEDEAIVEAALFQGRAPVLIIPPSGLAIARPKTVMVAWNQSREAMTAVRQALPLLISAETVDIVVVDPSAYGAERSDPGGLLCQMLVRHGVKARVSVLAKTLPRVSEVLAQHALDCNADLMVMGAYGHSRLREAILGGATRNLLEQAQFPVLMAH